MSNEGEEAESLVSAIASQGVRNVEVLDLKRTDWLKLSACAGRLCFWEGACKPHQMFQFYLDKIHDKVMEMKIRTGKPAVLIGHSAGGWLARAMMSDGRWRSINPLTGNRPLSSDMVCGLVTLGTPHQPPSEPYSDPSRGALSHVHEYYPGAYLRDRGKIFYLSVAGNSVRGSLNYDATPIQRFAANSYLSVTGDLLINGEEPGDGIVPVRFAHLQGAYQITLPDVWHGMYKTNDLWYGSTSIVEKWLPPALQVLQHTILKRHNDQVVTKLSHK